jgi:uncharacterized OB-fold protein
LQVDDLGQLKMFTPFNKNEQRRKRIVETPLKGSITKKQVPVEEGLFYKPASPKEKPYLIGSRCSLCGNVTFPKMKVCPRCAKKDTMEEVHLSGRGKLDTFSIVNAALPGFKAPSIQAYINLEEGPRIWSLITGVEADEKALKIGMELELVVEKVREDAQGNEVISYQFRPIKE